MEAVALSAIRVEFAKRAEWKRDEERRDDQIRLKQDKDKKEEREREADHEALADMVSVVMASESELADFSIELESYETATVEALMENEEQLRLVDEQLQLLLDQAYVLPDGRRVFKTEDGTRVFDEHGAEVKDFDPDEIENWRPYWERFDDPFKRKFALTEERAEILEFQKRTDAIDAEVKAAQEHGGMSTSRLEEIKQQLADEAPEAVERARNKDVSDLSPDNLAAAKPETLSRPTAKLDMPSL